MKRHLTSCHFSFFLFFFISFFLFSCGNPTSSDTKNPDSEGDDTKVELNDNKSDPKDSEEPTDPDNPQNPEETNPSGNEGAPKNLRPDLLTFSNGAIPVGIYGEGKNYGVNWEFAVSSIDGNPGKFGYMPKPTDGSVITEFVYQLPALTTFDRFAVPNVLETPSPFQTFAKNIEVLGSTEGPESGFKLLAKGELTKHEKKGQITEIPVSASTPVKWIKLKLSGGLEIINEKTFFDFSELIGNGTQETSELVDHFNGIWKDRGVLIDLKQSGPTVTGCFDNSTDFNGTVTGNILKGSGIHPTDSTMTLFVLSVLDNGDLRGLASSNGGPFRLYAGPPAPKGTTTKCSPPTKPALGCGSIVYGINFDYDSAKIRAESSPVLAKLFEGLQADKDAQIVIGGHTSSEGSDAYNLKLSERRAQSVVDDLVRRGLDKGRIRAAGYGESTPIASNDDESGRSMNRRVEVKCR